MRGDMRELLSSLDLQPTVDKVEQGVTLDFAQYSLLRDSADAKLYQLMHKVNGNGSLTTRSLPSRLTLTDEASISSLKMIRSILRLLYS